ncbi:MAG: hypothetical protein JW894_05840 [Bacteroidales bacterium]|nr:hypothetical protein [Bacteroidales bacterium]
MKTLNALFVIVIFLAITTQAEASDREQALAASNTLSEQIEQVCNEIPYTDYLEKYENSILVLTFKVDSEGHVKDLKVEGENKSLASLLKKEINEKVLQADVRMRGYTFQVPVNFISLN